MNTLGSADFEPIVSRSKAREAFRDALRLYVGRGRRYSVKQLSNGCGIADRLIESYVAKVDSADYRPPSLECQLSLSRFLGPEFTSEWLRLADQGAFTLPDADDTPPGALAADACEDAAAIARRAADGVLDQADVVELRPTGRRMMVQGARLAFGGTR